MAPSRLDALPIGAQHPRVRELLAVRKDSVPGRILVEGNWEHNQLLTTETTIDALYYCPEAAEDPVLRNAPRPGLVRSTGSRRNCSPESPGRTDRTASSPSRASRSGDLRSSTSTRPHWSSSPTESSTPANLGTLIRTVDAARADCLVLTSRRARLNHPSVYPASRGMVLTTPVIEFDDITAAATWLRQHEFEVHLADPSANGSYRVPEYRGRPTAFVVGSEGGGLSESWHRQGFGAVSIPMLGQADSLNVALSAYILLFEARARKEGW